MGCIRLIHWNDLEAKERVEQLRSAEYEISYDVPDGPDFLGKIKKELPLAVVIDLSRLPAQGRDIALALRHNKTTRHVPLVFVEGDQKKVAGIKNMLPDAVYTSWPLIRSSLKKAIAYPPANPVVPKSVLDGYSGTALPKKLGIKKDMTINLVNAPRSFKHTLGDLPEGVLIRENLRGRGDMIIWFIRSLGELHGKIEKMAARTGLGRIWIAWPKKASGKVTDLSQTHVRKSGLAAGLVDYKICSIDSTWSGLLFTRRKSNKYK